MIVLSVPLPHLVAIASWLFCSISALVPHGHDDVIVETRLGSIRGTRRTGDIGLKKEVTSTVDEFLGVPFAAPPVRNRRFQPTAPPSAREGVYDATYHRPACPQDAPQFDLTQRRSQSEDCLYLNIYSPYEVDTPSASYPVMVFIHGGSYVYGTGNRYNGTALAHKGVVLVATNYRLGALGFLTTGDANMPGNYGLLDQIQALKWIRENIRSFRGDPDKITVFGSSAGGASVGLLLMSPMAKGLFHRAIAQSGTANAVWASHVLPDPHLREHVTLLAAAHQCDLGNDAKMLQCLRAVHWEHFRSDEVCRVLPCIEVDPLFKPVADGIVIKENVGKTLLKSSFPVNIPYMTGTVRAEFGDHFSEDFTKEEMSAEVDTFVMKRYGSAAAQTIMFHYTDWSGLAHSPVANNTQFAARYYNRAEVLTDMGLVAPTAEFASRLSQQEDSQVYLYYFDNEPSFHSVELNYIFGVAFIGGSVDEMGVFTNFTSQDREKSLFFMDIWVNFASDGRPMIRSTPIVKEWRKVQPEEMDFLRIDFTKSVLKASMSSHLQAPQVALWNILVPEVMSSCPSSQKSVLLDTNKTWVFFGLTIGLLALVILLLCVIIWGSRKSKKYTQLLRNNSEKSYAVNL